MTGLKFETVNISYTRFFFPKWKAHTKYGGILTYKKRTDKIIYRKVGEVNIFSVILFPCLKADLTWNTKIDASTAVLQVFPFWLKLSTNSQSENCIGAVKKNKNKKTAWRGVSEKRGKRTSVEQDSQYDGQCSCLSKSKFNTDAVVSETY